MKPPLPRRDVLTFRRILGVEGAVLVTAPKQKSVLITGATSGIGHAAAELFGRKGYRVFATFRGDADGQALRRFANVRPVRMDFTHRKDICGAIRVRIGGVRPRGHGREPHGALQRVAGLPAAVLEGTVVDTQATPPGSYIQPNGGRTDILQQDDHGAGQSHTHNPIVNTNPSTGQTFQNGLQKGAAADPVSAQDVANIQSGAAPRAPPKGR